MLDYHTLAAGGLIHASVNHSYTGLLLHGGKIQQISPTDMLTIHSFIILTFNSMHCVCVCVCVCVIFISPHFRVTVNSGETKQLFKKMILALTQCCISCLNVGFVSSIVVLWLCCGADSCSAAEFVHYYYYIFLKNGMNVKENCVDV